VKERKEVRKQVKKTQSKVERTTLGDMAAFSALQEQLDESKKAAAAAPAQEEE